MVREQVSIDDVIQFLNELLEIDRPAVAALLANRVPCNEDMANHPTVQVRSQHGGYHVGLFGILNGLFGLRDDGWGQIMYVFDDGFLVRFDRVPATQQQTAALENQSTHLQEPG